MSYTYSSTDQLVYDLCDMFQMQVSRDPTKSNDPLSGEDEFQLEFSNGLSTNFGFTIVESQIYSARSMLIVVGKLSGNLYLLVMVDHQTKDHEARLIFLDGTKIGLTKKDSPSLLPKTWQNDARAKLYAKIFPAMVHMAVTDLEGEWTSTDRATLRPAISEYLQKKGLMTENGELIELAQETSSTVVVSDKFRTIGPRGV